MVSKDEKRWRAAAHIVMIVLSALAILPFILLIIASFTDEDVALKYGYSYFPQKLSLDAYRYIAENGATFFRAYGYGDWNGVLYCADSPDSLCTFQKQPSRCKNYEPDHCYHHAF